MGAHDTTSLFSVGQRHAALNPALPYVAPQSSVIARLPRRFMIHNACRIFTSYAGGKDTVHIDLVKGIVFVIASV